MKGIPRGMHRLPPDRQHARRSVFPDERPGLPEFPSKRVHRQRSRRNLLCARKSDENIRMFMNDPVETDRGASFGDVTQRSPVIRVIGKFFEDRRQTCGTSGGPCESPGYPFSVTSHVIGDKGCESHRSGEISERQFRSRFIYIHQEGGIYKKKKRNKKRIIGDYSDIRAFRDERWDFA